ncbi:MAG: helix-turn-helix protein [Methanoregulaceae archaeon PtaB.Bin056]|nr:MAG: helix-turn-helix protein [Methanoregulaceae archaeon PtaB.Bin056]
MKNKIKIFRAMHDITQETLAQEMGVARQTILAIEKGKYDPSLDLAFKLARRFGVRIDELFAYGEEFPQGSKIRGGIPENRDAPHEGRTT